MRRGVKAKGAIVASFALALAACALFVGSAFADTADAGVGPGKHRSANDAGPHGASPPSSAVGASDDAGSKARIPPDPPALSERDQWIFDLRWDRGEVYLVSIQKEHLPAPRQTPRVMGRFALELYEGPTLIERVRFDFPMLGAEAIADAGPRTPPRLEPHLRTRIGVLFPATNRGTRLELWDRATDRRWSLPWPPRAAIVPPPGPADAGVVGAR